MVTYLILPLYINGDLTRLEIELDMLRDCIESLALSEDIHLIIYNQGCLKNEEVKALLASYSLFGEIIGEGQNIGIVLARYRSMEYLVSRYPEARYVGEIHVDMIFSPNWHKPLIEYLESSEEPLVAPRVLYFDQDQYYYCDSSMPINFPQDYQKKVEFLSDCGREGIYQGVYYHPVIHKVDILKEIGSYDIDFLVGQQSFEDDSILLGYSYYLGLDAKWVPKCCLKSCVYHHRAGQRYLVENWDKERLKNMNGLFCQYGSLGFKELARIHGSSFFQHLHNANVVQSEIKE